MKCSRWRAFGLVLAVLLPAGALVSGCGGSGDRQPVEGTVTLNGKPVDGGMILFLPAEDNKGDAGKFNKAHATIRDGKYALEAADGPNTGKYKVQIVWNRKTGKQVPGDGPNMIDETEQVVPLIYNAQSTVVVDIKSGKNTFNYELKGAPPPKNADPKKAVGD
jgi:hypothetical protein